MPATVEIRNNLKTNGPTNPQVGVRVLGSLKTLIQPGMLASQEKMNIINFAVTQLCQAKSVEDIDWVRVVGLAADINGLWNWGGLRE